MQPELTEVNLTKKLPFYKKKWYVGSKIQQDFLVCILCFSLLSQMVLVSHIMAEQDILNEFYWDQIAILLKVIFCGYLVYGFWLSNRIAGPLARFKNHMDEVAQGKVDAEIQFRKNDYGSELAESFNDVVRNRFEKP